MVLTALGALLTAAAPAPAPTPDGDEARRWAEQELRDPVYAASEPTFFDRIARAVADFFARLFDPQVGGGWGPALAIGAVVVVIVLIVVALILWGRPRVSARSRPGPAELFGEAEGRSAAQLRRDASAAAQRGDWDAAIVLRFRAIARGLDERTIVEAEPGATVHRFARQAARAFPAAAATLQAAAAAFDDVRYLRRPGTAELYGRVAAADEAVQRGAPEMARIGVPG